MGKDKQNTTIRERSARTGKWVKTGTDKRHPDTTVRERVPLPTKGKGK